MQEAEPGGQLGNTAVEDAAITWRKPGGEGVMTPAPLTMTRTRP